MRLAVMQAKKRARAVIWPSRQHSKRPPLWPRAAACGLCDLPTASVVQGKTGPGLVYGAEVWQ